METNISELTEAIHALTEAISRPALAMRFPIAPNPEFLADLYHGRYEPETNRKCEADQALIQEIEERRRALRSVLPGQGKKMLSEYDDAVAQYHSTVAERFYEAGFKTAVQMMAAGLSNDLK